MLMTGRSARPVVQVRPARCLSYMRVRVLGCPLAVSTHLEAEGPASAMQPISAGAGHLQVVERRIQAAGFYELFMSAALDDVPT